MIIGNTLHSVIKMEKPNIEQSSAQRMGINYIIYPVNNAIDRIRFTVTMEMRYNASFRNILLWI